MILGCVLPLLYACGNEEEEGAPTPQVPDTSVPPAEEDRSIVGAIAAREDLSSLESAIAATQLAESFRADGPFTLFVPNNDAFTRLLENQGVGTLDALVEKLGAEAVASILQAHAVNETLTSDGLRDKDVYTSLSGATLTITEQGPDLLVNGALVVESDLVAENGVMHVIDEVVNLSAANDGSNGFTVTVENVSKEKRFFQHGIFDAPMEANEVYEFSFYAGPTVANGQPTRLSFMTKFAEANASDLFIATSDDGIELYDGDTPITGDISDQIFLWDAGTRVNGTQEAENATVRLAEGTGSYPKAQALVKVTISNQAERFIVRIQNVSATSDTPGTLSSGVYGVHTLTKPLFERGQGARNEGQIALAEDSDPTALNEAMEKLDGFVVPLSPGVFAIHDSEVRPVLVTGEVDRGVGLESLAEDGDPTLLGEALAADAAVDSSGTFGTAPLKPGEKYSFTISGASPGDHFSIVSMMMQSNDIVYSTPDNGIPLFNENGRPFNGNASRLIVSYDVGTEANEFPGAGLNQPIRQAAPNTGAADPNKAIRRVVMDDRTPSDDGFIYRPEGERIKITIIPNP